MTEHTPHQRLTDAERDDLTEAHLYDAMNGGDRATFETVEDILAVRHATARSAYVALLNLFHEAVPDHCGGECFTAAMIDAALGQRQAQAPSGLDEDGLAASRLGQPRAEWAVEVTWRDWEKAGAKGPTSQYGQFTRPESRDAFVDEQRRDRDIAATRVLERQAAYSPWVALAEAEPTSEEDRQARTERHYARMFPHLVSAAEETLTEG